MAAPPMNEGAPDNIFSLSSYFEREQYPSTPLIYGSTPYSQPMLKEEFIDGKPNYSRYILVKGEKKFTPYLEGAVLNHRSGMTTSDDTLLNQRVESKGHGYLLSDYNFKQKLTPELDMWFPRITSRKGADISAYSDWAGMTVDNMQKLNISETIDSAGNFQPRAQMWGFRQPVYSYRPTYVQNLRYFRNYQVYYMYLRYLFWNFIGRQNDMPSTGEIEHGNFVTGIPPIDSYWLGVTSDTPSEIWSENKGSNRYFGIPFIIGIIGLLWLISGNLKKRRCFYLVSLIFLMTGLAIVVYLNQTPGEPRERDYTFLGSYMAFVMWIGAGLTGILRLLPFFLTKKTGLIFSTLISFAPATLMAVENFDDHDRRGRFEPEFYASSILDFEEPAIIFTHGDNSTFPIWYASEVIGAGKNHTPIDVTYLSLPSYVINLKKQGDKGISTIGSSPQLAFGGYLLSRIPADSVSEALPIDLSLSHLYSSQANYPVFPSAAVKVPKSNRDSATIHLREFSGGSSYLQFRHLMLLDIIASQLKSEKSKVIFFPSSIEHGFYKPLDNLLQPALFGKIYAPGLQDDEITALLKKSLEQELKKLNELLANRPDLASHYMDPVIADMSVRYRGEMLLAAGELMARGDTISAINTVDVLAKAFPYHKLLPGNFTLGDSTFYEGVEFRNLTAKIYDATQNIRYRDLSNSVDSIINSRHIQWLKYYHSLPPEQRKYLSNRSKRLLIKPNL